MARIKSSANSAVGKVSTPIEKPKPTLEELKTQYFAHSQKALKKYTDPNKLSTTSLNTYNRENIRNYLQNPGSNQSKLREVANYLYVRSQVMYRLVHWYAGMWDLRCRNIQPKYDLLKGFDDNVLKNYQDTLNCLDIYNLQANMYEVLIHCYLEDVCYFVWFRDENGAFPYILPAEDCKIIGRYDTGDLAYAVNMANYKSQKKRNFIEWFGEPFTSMMKEYEDTNVKYIQMPDEYAGCFKFNLEHLDLVMPPFAPMFQQLATLLDGEDLSAIQDKLDVFKMLLMPMKSLSGAKETDKFEFTPDLMIDYFEQMVSNAIPPYVSAAPILGDGVEVIDFSSTSSDSQVDRLANSQKNVMNISGGGAVLNASMITSTAAFNAWLQAETDFAISSLMPQIDSFTNRMLSYDVNKPCKVRHFELSEYTKKDFRDKFLESGQYGYMYRIALGTLYGMSEKETLAQLHFEQEILGLQNIMIYPLQSSFTSSGSTDTDPITGGAPTKDATELTDSGERDRNQ